MNIEVRLPDGSMDYFKDQNWPVNKDYINRGDYCKGHTVTTRRQTAHYFLVTNGILEVHKEDSVRNLDTGSVAYNISPITTLVGSYRSNQYTSVRELA